MKLRVVGVGSALLLAASRALAGGMFEGPLDLRDALARAGHCRARRLPAAPAERRVARRQAAVRRAASARPSWGGVFTRFAKLEASWFNGGELFVRLSAPRFGDWAQATGNSKKCRPCRQTGADGADSARPR